MPHLLPFRPVMFAPNGVAGEGAQELPKTSAAADQQSDGSCTDPATLNLTSFLAPTYDQVNQQVVASLLARNPFNVVQFDAMHGYRSADALEDSAGRADDSEAVARQITTDYAAARRRYDKMRSAGILQMRERAALYIVRQTFVTRQRRPHRRLALLGALPSTSVAGDRPQGVLAHEMSESDTVADRLALLDAMQVQTSPVFGLYQDPGNAIEDWMRERMIDCEPIAFGVAPDGTLHELWEVTNQAQIEDVARRFGDRPVVIADGHNRFNAIAAWARRGNAGDGNAQSSGAAGDAAAADNPDASVPVMFALVAEQDPGMSLLPVHRAYSGIRSWSMEAFKLAASDLLRVDRVEGSLEDLLDQVALARYEGSHAMGIFDFEQGESWVSTTINLDPLQVAYPETKPVWRQSDQVLCEHLIHDIILTQRINRGRRLRCHRTADIGSLAGMGDSGPDQAQLAVVMMPIALPDVFEFATGGHLLPPNSTHFVPKFTSGLLMLPLGDSR
ncbi:MAG: DUF1015 family protein [Planctomycetota bacterium]